VPLPEMRSDLLILCLAISLTLVSGISIGDRVFRTGGIYVPMPTNTANATFNNWVASRNGQCDPVLGIAYNYKSQSGPTTSAPVTLFFTAGEQLAGIGMTMYGSPPENQIGTYWQEVAEGQYFISVTFRNSSIMCSGDVDDELPLGDQLVINADSLAYEIPVLESDAVEANFTKGSCFYGMGFHYSYDLATAPIMSWSAANLMPIVPMYYNGAINAFFFATPVVQQGLLNNNMWDPVAFIDSLMCKNWCDSECTWTDTLLWSTGHFYLHDYTQVTCSNGCKIQCDCPSMI